jgi:hypothetical protein
MPTPSGVEGAAGTPPSGNGTNGGGAGDYDGGPEGGAKPSSPIPIEFDEGGAPSWETKSGPNVVAIVLPTVLGVAALLAALAALAIRFRVRMVEERADLEAGEGPALPVSASAAAAPTVA